MADEHLLETNLIYVGELLYEVNQISKIDLKEMNKYQKNMQLNVGKADVTVTQLFTQNDNVCE